jgi:hypothetical protein
LQFPAGAFRGGDTLGICVVGVDLVGVVGVVGGPGTHESSVGIEVLGGCVDVVVGLPGCVRDVVRLACSARAACSSVTSVFIDAHVMITCDDRLVVAARHNDVTVAAPGSKALSDHGLE